MLTALGKISTLGSEMQVEKYFKQTENLLNSKG